MRGVAGLAFVFLGLVMGYLVLSGKFPSASPLVNPNPSGTPGNEVPTSSTSNSFLNGGTVHATGKGVTAGGSSALSYQQGPLGLPTMVNLNDLVPSNGGMN